MLFAGERLLVSAAIADDAGDQAAGSTLMPFVFFVGDALLDLRGLSFAEAEPWPAGMISGLMRADDICTCRTT